MIPSLKFAQRAIDRSDGNPSSSFFKIESGRVTGFNGTLAMSAPLQLSFNCAPSASHFVKAINACEGVVSIAQESVHKIIVTSGKFKASVPCVPVQEVQSVTPEGTIHKNVSNLPDAFRVLRPFLANETDSGRDWSRNIRLDSGCAYVTDNTVLIQYWLGVTTNPINIPFEAVDEVCRVSDKLEAIQLNDNSITFWFENGTWIRSQLNVAAWPNLMICIGSNFEDCKLAPVSEDFKDACSKLGKFGGKDYTEVYFRGSDIATSRKETKDIATIATMAPSIGCYALKHLNKVLNVATNIDFNNYPKPACFEGDNLRGVFVGVREETV
jgi:hypothetical protein